MEMSLKSKSKATLTSKERSEEVAKNVDVTCILDQELGTTVTIVSTASHSTIWRLKADEDILWVDKTISCVFVLLQNISA
jgi:hypothetical protein